MKVLPIILTWWEAGRRLSHKNVHNLFLFAALAFTSRVLVMLEACSTTELHAPLPKGPTLKGRKETQPLVRVVMVSTHFCSVILH